MTLLYSIIVFVLVVLVHEFGHFIVAKLSGIRVNEFSIGMGPLLFSKQKGETQYSLRAIPIGGFVQLEGEDEETDDPRSFGNASPFKRILVLLAGAFMNFVLAILAFTILASIIGVPTTTIDVVGDGSPAMNAGIVKGDKILEIDGESIKEWYEISPAINNSENEKLVIKLERDGKIQEVQVTPELRDGNKVIDIQPMFANTGVNFIKSGFNNTIRVITEVYGYLGQMISGKVGVNNLSGPVGIVMIIGESTKAGLFGLLSMIGLISANLGAINLVPFPALDGGTIFITLIEMIIGRELPEKARIAISSTGLILLLGLIIYVTIFNDIKGLLN